MLSTAELLRHARRGPEVVQALTATPAALRLVTRYLEIGRPSYPVQIPLRSGGVLTLDTPNEVKVFWQITVRKSYSLPQDCATILDCGANIGIFTVWAARERPTARIVAVEPCRETFERLKEHVRRNHLESRVECLPFGLAAQHAERYLGTADESPNRKLIAAGDTPPPDHAERVTCVTLAECMRIANMHELDMLKMDIEGSEWEVLLATPQAALSRIRHIQLEYHQVHARFHYTPERLFNHLAGAGHRLTFRTEDRFQTGLAFFERAG